MSDTRATSNPRTHDPGTNNRITGPTESRAAEEMAKLGPFLFAKKYGISVPEAVALEKYLRPKPIVLSSRQRTPPVARPLSEEERKRAAIAEAAAKVRAGYAEKSRAVPLYGVLAFGVHDMPDEDAILHDQLAEVTGEAAQLIAGVDLRSAGRSPSRAPRGRSAASSRASRGSWTPVKSWKPAAKVAQREELAVVREKAQGKAYREYKQRYESMKEKGTDPERFLEFRKEDVLAQVNIGVLRGSRMRDEAAANRLAGYPPNGHPKTHVWHHHQDLGVMQLVPRTIHAVKVGNNQDHWGGVQIHKAIGGEGYR